MRRLRTLVGFGLWIAAAPAAGAQEAITVAVCLPCHGVGAPGVPGAPPIPSLDGQHREYLIKQLREFKAGKRRNDFMAPLVGAMKKHQMPALAAHFAAQSPAPGPAVNEQLAARGKVLYEEGNQATGVPGCVGCHLAEGLGTRRYPRLAGQRQAYVVQQLMNFKSGARTNDRAGVMRYVAGRLTDEEMRAVAEYVAGLR